MKDDIRQFLISALIKMKYDPETVSGSSSLGPAGIDLDSLGVADLVMQLEDRFGVQIDEDESERFAMMTIDQIAEESASRLQAA
ncbi:acyl carrier protein [Streptomyces sp. SID13666]|uniref:acyl carrier protein n=1 Tax=Streptomyces TaxID=1883 RepID=UPI0013BF9CCA|nr:MULTISPECIES: phosphopantetheine-binding protein [Streptomyces]MCZ4097996.1 phosphopantetheine-binding protein [Streptomyces sp. H39-C1]NEA58561.1 acyl carrier protein [Streptomyces sp. SID13666]NEA74717.1 acyl carrier protein [Streptomyces sp. SID13588]QNA71746.1 acyl carrier protein [Streptomyces sp. So13.3]